MEINSYKKPEDASALVLVLLITALLATIAVSFLSTSRVEMMAARNFSRQNAAAGLAEGTTQQAMATIQTAFNGDGTGTGIVITQPGAISKYFFSNGTCLNASNATTNLFFTSNSANANGTVNMNNLFANSTVSGLITGNASEAITVASVNVLSGNQVIGKVAYYVDDELTKINLNSAAGNRTTVNFSYGKAASLSGAANFTGNTTNFDAVINGTASSNSSNLSTWTSFFRPEQAKTVLGLNATQWASWQANFSAAPPSDFHLKYTPWGTQRLFINDEPANETGVANLYSSFTGLNATTGNFSASPNSYEINGMALRNIYNGTFSDKYSDNGTKQIAANILQLKHRNTAGMSWDGCSGPMIGAANLTDSSPIPPGYFGYAPIAVINEVAIQPEQDIANGILYICAYIEFYSPCWYSNKPYTVKLDFGGGSFFDGNSTVSFPSALFSRNTTSAVEYRNLEKFILGSQSVSSFNGTLNLTMGNIRLLAPGGNATDLRDWITGSVINKLLPFNNFTINSSLTANYTASVPWNTTWTMKSIQRKDVRIRQDSSGNYSLNNNSTTSPWAVNFHSLPPDRIGGNGVGRENGDYSKIQNVCNYANHVEYSDNAGCNYKELRTGNNTYPAMWDTSRTIFNSYIASSYFTTDLPADQTSQGDSLSRFRFFNANRYDYPLLSLKDASGNGLYTSPTDLGKPMTDRNFRSLRLFWQPTQERAKGYIPDWALLDLVSFSSNITTSFPQKIAPINLNGRFISLTQISASTSPKPRNNIQCLTKPLDSSNVVASSVATSISPRSYGTFAPGFFGQGAGISAAVSSNLTQHITTNSSNATIAWAKSGNNTWSAFRSSNSTNWPSKQLILPSEITEIRSVSDFESWPDSGGTSEKLENRLTAFFPGLTFCSNFFTIYAYAQALDKAGSIDSEALTKTLVEVEITTPATATTGAVYKVKKLYTQPIPLGQ